MRHRVAICVCTFRRAEDLDRLLERLTMIAAEVRTEAHVGVVVVDDDPAGSASTVCARHAEAFELGLQYVHSGQRNIAKARNLALDHGMRDADWLALTDDDCRPDHDWLRQLLAVREAYDAEGVCGRCIDEPPPDGPAWFSTEPFLVELDGPADGDVIEVGALKNMLVSAETVRHHRLRFDEAFGTIGGEDVMFFRSAHRAGVRLRFARAAVVREPIPTARATLGYQLRRFLWHGNTEAVTSVAAQQSTRRRMAARGVKQILASVARPLGNLARGHRAEWRYALCGALLGIGRMLGAAGVRLRHR